MASDVAPEVARLIAFAERPRVGDWSLRAALVRYAQPQPVLVNKVLDLVRRIESAPEGLVIALLPLAAELEQLGDTVAAWAVDATGNRPDAEVAATADDLAQRLDQLGVPREERPPPTRRRAAPPPD